MSAPSRWTPPPKAEWVRVGERCVSVGGMRGEVLRVIRYPGHTHTVVVHWENGHTGRITITNVRREVTS